MLDPLAASAALSAGASPLATRVQATVASILSTLPAGHPTIALALQRLAARPTVGNIRATIAQLSGASGTPPKSWQIARSVVSQLQPLLAGLHFHPPVSGATGAAAYGAPELSGLYHPEAEMAGLHPELELSGAGVPLPPIALTQRAQAIRNAASAQLAALPPAHPIISQILQAVVASPSDKHLRLAVYELQGTAKTTAPGLTPKDKQLALQVSQALAAALQNPILGGVVQAGSVMTPPLAFPPSTQRQQVIWNAVSAQLASLPQAHPIIKQILQAVVNDPTDTSLRLAVYELQGTAKPGATNLTPSDKQLALQVSTALMPLLQNPILGGVVQA